MLATLLCVVLTTPICAAEPAASGEAPDGAAGSAVTPEPEPGTAFADAPADVTAGSDAAAVTGLLEQAEAAFDAAHYIYPAAGSAMSLYHQALVLEPENPEARRGLERLVDHFLGSAVDAIEQRRLTTADAMLSRARLVDRDNPNIKPIEAQLRLIENAKREKLVLDWRKLSRRDPGLAPRLEQIGALARQPGCRTTITVSNDSEGRWVYRKLNGAQGEARIRADLRIASPPSVEVLCF